VVGGQGKAPISIIVGLDGRRNPREMEVRRPGPALRDSIAGTPHLCADPAVAGCGQEANKATLPALRLARDREPKR
jgi:hypothetical protein